MIIELILAGIVGFLIGVLAALFIDSQTLVRKIQAANAEKQNAQAALQKFQIQHRAAEQKLKIAENELETAVAERTQLEETIAKQFQELLASREQVQNSIATNETLKENAQEAQERLEELDGMRLMSEEKVRAAEAELNRLASEVQLLEAEVVLQAEKAEKLGQQIAEQTKLEQKLEAVEALSVALEVEKDTAVAQLQQAELAIAEQNANIVTLQTQLKEAQAVQQQLVVTQEKLQTSDAHLNKLQTKMDDVQTKMSYSGKNQLQLIRGIGPTYARRLNEFGIQTFADLAECDEDQIAKIIKKKEWQSVNILEWIDEAKALAASLNEDA